MITEPSFLDLWIGKRAPILDVGCGEGLYLSYLKKHNIRATGIEAHRATAKRARDKKLDVVIGDAFRVLPKLRGRSGAVVISHLIEHLSGDQAARLMRLAYNCLRPGGRILVLTPNPRNIKTLAWTFWEDPTHVRPYSLPALSRLFDEAGFHAVALKELPEPSGPFLWKIRDIVRRILIGPFWGSQELLAVGERPSRGRSKNRK